MMVENLPSKYYSGFHDYTSLGNEHSKNWNIQVMRCIKKNSTLLYLLQKLVVIHVKYQPGCSGNQCIYYFCFNTFIRINITQSSSAWFHTSTVKYMRTVLFKVITHQVVVIPFWCFRTAYWSHLQGSVLHPCPLKMGWWILDSEDGTDRFVLNCQ
jgi:hypothetical protein